MTEKTLVIGVDIAKERHYCRAFNYRGVEVGKVYSFTNNFFGFQSFKEWSEELMQANGCCR